MRKLTIVSALLVIGTSAFAQDHRARGSQPGSDQQLQRMAQRWDDNDRYRDDEDRRYRDRDWDRREHRGDWDRRYGYRDRDYDRYRQRRTCWEDDYGEMHCRYR
jgi:hypothetical protein